MAGKFTAQVRAWSEKAKRNAGLVVADAAQGVFDDMTERQPSVKETGGSFLIGRVPVDTGELINSAQTSLNGGIVGEGPNSYTAALVGMELGDSIQVAFTAEHAPFMEYGTGSISGRFFVREAISGWQARVDRSAAKFKD